jgi:hypothetical protein
MLATKAGHVIKPRGLVQPQLIFQGLIHTRIAHSSRQDFMVTEY